MKINKKPKTIGQWKTYCEYVSFKALGYTEKEIEKLVTFYKN